jgi:hypothetical protein
MLLSWVVPIALMVIWWRALAPRVVPFGQDDQN